MQADALAKTAPGPTDVVGTATPRQETPKPPDASLAASLAAKAAQLAATGQRKKAAGLNQPVYGKLATNAAAPILRRATLTGF